MAIDLDLDAFLHSITYLPIKDNNKHFIFNLGDTKNVMFSLNNFLDFDLINTYYYRLCVFSCVNRTILDITFKFIVGLNMRLIFDYFYASRKKQQLFNHFDLIYGQGLLVTFNIERFYIDFFFLFFFFFIIFFFFSFYFFFSFKIFVLISWNLVFIFCYISIIWEVWEFFFSCELVVLWRMLPGILYKKYYQQRCQDSSTNDVTVREDDSLELMRF
jgi:hypothetical protein